jgi:hypothetical protein
MDTNDGKRDADRGTEMSTRDQVSLSTQERQLLAHLEARARTDDPALAARLRGRTGRAVVARWTDLRAPEMASWVGGVVFVLGLLVTVVAVTSVVWLSVLGLALCVVGGCRLGVSLRDHLADRATPPAP